MNSPRRTSRLGDRTTQTGLAARINRNSEESDRKNLVRSRGTDELLARAREAGNDDSVDASTLEAIESRLRDV